MLNSCSQLGERLVKHKLVIKARSKEYPLCVLSMPNLFDQMITAEVILQDENRLCQYVL